MNFKVLQSYSTARVLHSARHGLLAILFFSGTLISTSIHAQTNPVANTRSGVEMNPYWKALEVSSDIYDSPYAIALFSPEHGEDSARVWSQTKSMFAYGLGVVALLAVLPEDFTNWDTDSDILKKYADNVKAGPVWDRDVWYVNYIGHTYVGGIYYQVARKSGYRQWDAFIYTTLMSTFYWEYGVEAFAETPSIQDLFFTPILGWVYGEWAYQTEIGIRNNNSEVLGSSLLGGTALFFLDPIDVLGSGVNRLTGHNLIKSGYGYFTYQAVPSGSQTDHQFYLHMRIPLGVSGPEAHPEKPKTYSYSDDPVDTGIVGFSVGEGYTIMDEKWGVENGLYDKISIGLYFTPRISARLAYARGSLKEKDSDSNKIYENYSMDGQIYLNKAHRIRPYVTAGFGEQLWDEDDDMDTFQLNGGLGVHCKLLNKLSLQADWLNYYSPENDHYDQQFNLSLIYRFGRGEHEGWF